MFLVLEKIENMQIEEKQTIASIVRENYKTAEIFSKHKIDFCCGGKKSVGEACANSSVDFAQISKELDEICVEMSSENEYSNWESSKLIDYILENHHVYVKESVPYLSQLLSKIADVHGENHPELLEVRDIYEEATGALWEHMENEELVVFPAIKVMEEANKKGEEIPPMGFGNVNNSIAIMEEEHDFEGVSFKKIAALTHDFTPPEDACNTYTVAFAKLKEFVADLHQHIHLENNVLFENAKTLEAGFK
jgi:regulator of cell morphogenesis and NO signaling